MLKILFVIRAVEHYPYFHSIITAFKKHGHRVEVLFDYIPSSEKLSYIKDLKINGVKYGWAPYSKAKWRKIIFYFRDFMSLRRYYKISGQSSFYKNRWEEGAPAFIKVFLSLPFIKPFILNGPFPFFMASFERLMPFDRQIVEKIKQFKPDVLVASPCNFPFASCEVEYLKTAKRFGVKTVTPVFSWDNLTTKGFFSIKPDLLLVWNKTQVSEAWQHHGISGGRIKITGAPFFDPWFKGLKPSQAKEVFAAKLGFDPKKPILLYLASSYSISTDESWLIKKLHMNLKNVQILIRPHPNHIQHYDVLEDKSVKVFPKRSSLPHSKEAIQTFFDCLFYSFAVCGVNTSAMIEAAILKKPIIAIMTKKYTKTQSQAQHFKQLVKNDVLEKVKNMDEFKKTIERLFKGIDLHKRQREEFVKNFIRPCGLGIPAGEIAAIEIENLI